jgi:6-phosphogluconolactonase
MVKTQLQVFDDALSLSRAAAEYVAALAREPRPDGHPFSMAVCGGSTPHRLYRLLGQPPYNMIIPWSQVHVFWGDERCVPPDHPESNFHQAYDLWLQHVPLPPRNLHRIKGEAGATAAAEEYAGELQNFARASFAEAGQDWPRFDLILLGLGDDGHVASLFPGPVGAAETSRPALAVIARYQDRPAERVTLTPLVFNTARNAIFLVTGEAKAEALAAALRGPADPERWPAQRIRPEKGLVTWMVDRAAAARLDAGEAPKPAA